MGVPASVGERGRLPDRVHVGSGSGSGPTLHAASPHKDMPFRGRMLKFDRVDWLDMAKIRHSDLCLGHLMLLRERDGLQAHLRHLKQVVLRGCQGRYRYHLLQILDLWDAWLHQRPLARVRGGKGSRVLL